MKYLLLPAIIILFTSTISCRKLIDYIRDHPGAHDSLCQVTVLKFNKENKYFISYNDKGNPITMKDANRSLAAFDRYFRYDRFNRLSDFLVAYPGSFVADIWHKYGYPRPGYVTDTVMFYDSQNVNGPSPLAMNSYQYDISGYTLDAHERIVKIWSIPNDPPHIPVLYKEVHYDANGNLSLSSPDLSYDDKVNPYRTNKVWQFLFQDYSRNNIVKNDHLFFTTYNSFGLPLAIRNLQSYNIYVFGVDNIEAAQMDITYACSAPGGSINY